MSAHFLNSHFFTLSAFAVLVALLTLVTSPTPSIPLKPTHWGSYQLTMRYSNGSQMTGSSPLYTYNYVPPDTITDYLESSAVLSAFQYTTKPHFKFRLVGPTYNGSAFTLSVQVLSPCSFVFFKFFLIYNTQQSGSFFQISKNLFNPTIANGAIASAKTEQLHFTSRLHLAVTDSMDMLAFLSSVLLEDESGATQVNMVMDLNNPLPTALNYTVTVTLTTVTSISEIVITTIIIKRNLIPEQYVYQLVTSTNVFQTPDISTAGACFSKFGLNALYGPNFNRNCTLGIIQTDDDFSTTMPRVIDFDAVSGAGFSSCVNSANANTGLVQKLYYGSLCFFNGLCPTPTDFYKASSNDCWPCTTHNAQCSSCNRTECKVCNTLFYPSGTNCLPCTQTNCTLCLTISTCGQCTNASYVNNSICVACTTLTNCVYCITNITCIGCIPGFAPDPTGTCVDCPSLLPNCLLCSDYYTCTSCNTSYYIAPGGGCFACASTISYCDLCSSSLNCTACLPGYYLASNISCLFCGTTLVHCSRCTTSSNCISCQLGYYLQNATTCLGCTALIGCLNCTSASTCVQCQSGYYLTGGGTCLSCTASHCINCPNSTSCLGCETDFILTAANQCVCSIGKRQVTNICINSVGCVTAIKVLNVSTCIFCDSLGNFIISGTGCVCKTGYKLSGGTTCVTKCGDGLILGTEGCDDGNVVDGDGCSSLCSTEPNYNCIITTSGYHCVFTADYSTTLQYIWRDEASNTASYYFKFSPSTPNFGKINLQTLFTLTISSVSSSSYKTTSIIYNEGIIKVDVSFSQNLQNLSAFLTMNLDPNYFTTYNRTYTFLSTGTNAPLIITSLGGHVKWLKIFCYVILGLAGLILLLSIAFEKMIGIETVNCLQIIVFSKLLYVQSDLVIGNSLSTLKYIAGYSQVGEDLAQTHDLPLAYRRLIFNNDFLLNFETPLILIGISLIILIVFLIYRWKFRFSYRKTKSNVDEYKLAQQRLDAKQKFIYQRVILLVACITLFQAFAALRMQTRTLEGESQFNYFLINLLTSILGVGFILGVLSQQVLNIGNPHEWIAPFCSYSPYYIGYYICYILLITPVLIVGEIFLGAPAIFMCGGVLIIHLIIIIIWRPYEQTIHNAAIILNQSVGIAFLGFEAMMKLQDVNQTIELFVSYALLGSILVVQILAMVRIYFAFKPAKKQVQRLNRTQITKMEDQTSKAVENLERDFLNSNKKRDSSKLKGRDEDALIKLRSRLKKEYKENHQNQNEQL